MNSTNAPIARQVFLRQTNFVTFERHEIEQSIPRRFEQQVRAFPNRIAVKASDQTLTYRELDELSNKIAHALLSTCHTASNPVLLLLEHNIILPAAIMGVLKAGQIYVALDVAHPTSELERIRIDCTPSITITQLRHQAVATELAGGGCPVLVVEDIKDSVPFHNPGFAPSPDDLACIFYTSGSTGLPKGVVDNHRNVLHNIMRYTNSLAVSCEDRMSLIQSCSFSGTVSTLFSALLNGASVHMFDLQAKGAAELAHWLIREEITIFHSVPFIFAQILETRRDFASLRLIRLEGDRCHKRHIDLFHEAFDEDCVLVNGLGATETGLTRQFFVDRSNRSRQQVTPVGWATDDMAIRVVDPSGREARPGTTGEIIVSSRYLSPGYWKRPDLTVEAFDTNSQDPLIRSYRTGDIGHVDFDGCLTVLGRKNSQVKLRGRLVDLTQVETELGRILHIAQALVTVREDRPGIQQLTGYLFTDGGNPPSVSQIRNILMDRLPTWMVPARYVYLSQLPIDRNNKVDRKTLPPPDRTRPLLDQPFVAPSSRAEKQVARSFTEVLSIEPVGVHDDFFELGGDSLLVTELLALIETWMGFSVPLDVFFATPSIATIVKSRTSDKHDKKFVAIRRTGDLSPLFCISDPFVGHPMNFRQLSRLLDHRRPLYVSQFFVLDTDRVQYTSIEQMADAFAQEIMTLHPTGEYHLCGVCLGGTLAFEVARQMQQRNRPPALVVLLDTRFPTTYGWSGTSISWAIFKHRLQQLAQQPLKDNISYCFDTSMRRARAIYSAAKSRCQISAHDQTAPPVVTGTKTRHLAQIRYRAKPYDGKVVHFCIGAAHNQTGWQGVTTGEYDLIELEAQKGFETTHPTDEPYVGALAASLERRLKV